VRLVTAVIWRDFETAAPEIAPLGMERFDRVGIALLGTLRKDGSPRISPVETHLAGGHLVFGAMSWSMKARDLLRDPRCVLHSAVCNPDAGESEFKLYGRAKEVRAPEIRGRCRDAWWASRPPEDARVFSLNIEQAALVSWDIEHGEMKVRKWSPELGFSELKRDYP
jgi:hypothetical protein